MAKRSPFEIGSHGQIVGTAEPEIRYAFDPWQLADLIERAALRAQIETTDGTPAVKLEMPVSDARKLAAILKSVPRITS